LSSDLTFSHNHLILDACCIINLYASRRLGEILTALPGSTTVSDYVYRESGWVYDGPDDNARQTKAPINLQPFIQAELLSLVSIDSEAERSKFIHFAAHLDDGESCIGAIAVCRNWAVATDDKKAINLFYREAPDLQIVSTLELVKYWVDTTQPSVDTVRTALRNIRLRANYKPGAKHILYDWWQRF